MYCIILFRTYIQALSIHCIFLSNEWELNVSSAEYDQISRSEATELRKKLINCTGSVSVSSACFILCRKQMNAFKSGADKMNISPTLTLYCSKSSSGWISFKMLLATQPLETSDVQVDLVGVFWCQVCFKQRLLEQQIQVITQIQNSRNLQRHQVIGYICMHVHLCIWI